RWIWLGQHYRPPRSEIPVHQDRHVTHRCTKSLTRSSRRGSIVSAMAPATSSLLAGIPAHHLPGLVGGLATPLLVRLRLARVKRAALGRLGPLGWLLVFTGGVHIGLAFGHASSQAFLSSLFFVNVVAYLVLVVFRRERWCWRLATGLLLLGTVVAYLVFVGTGNEQPDPVGILDKLAEVMALGLVMLPHESSPGGWRRPLRWVIGSAA